MSQLLIRKRIVDTINGEFPEPTDYAYVFIFENAKNVKRNLNPLKIKRIKP